MTSISGRLGGAVRGWSCSALRDCGRNVPVVGLLAKGRHGGRDAGVEVVGVEPGQHALPSQVCVQVRIEAGERENRVAGVDDVDQR